MGHLFISYSHDDSVFAERLARDLQDDGRDVWIDFRGIRAGAEWEQAIFKGIEGCDFAIVCLTPASVQSDWVRREILMLRSRHKPIIPVLVKKQAETSAGLVETFKLLDTYEETRRLRDIQMVDFERYGYERAFPMLLEALPGVTTARPAEQAPIPEIDPASIPNPFKGLEAFQQTDAHLFFGREDLTQRLLERLDDWTNGADRFVAVVGASGSGKSSLVRAGLIPHIRADALPGSAGWIIAIFTPGPRPTEALAARLLPIIGGGRMLPEVLAALEKDDRALHQLTEGLLATKPADARLLLVIDQFEEVFTRASVEEARRFIALVNTAVTLEGGRTYAVLTMRADFFDRLSAFPPLARLFEQENLLIVTEMTPDALRRSIEGPAAAVGLTYDHGLVDLILEDVRQGTGALPLMQYALKRLYDQRDGRRLSKTAYAAMKGVRGALAEHAESLYAALTPETQDVARRLLLRLVEVSDTGEATRRRVPRAALTFDGVAPETVDALIATLTSPENRLLIASREVGGGETQPVYVEVAHEALLREWSRLANWIEVNQVELHYGGELLKDAQDWDASGRSADYLLTGTRLTRAQVWLERADASDIHRAYIDASVREAEAARTREAERQAREVALAQEAAANAQRAETAEKARATRARRAAVVASVAGVVAAVIAVVAFFAAQDASARSTAADQQLLVANSQLATATNAQGAALDLAATAQFGSTVSAFEGQRISTRVPGLGQLPPTPSQTLPPANQFASATQIAVAYGHDDDVVQEFNGVPMVLVPAGCFFMGSAAFTDAVPVTQVCFDAPYWIDQLEVTQGQFERLGGVKTNENAFDGDDRPVERITWFEARDFCALREARLPTEAEWEYAAAGPDSYPYPWGRSFPDDIENYAVFYQVETADVGEDVRMAGRSWVGAFDLSGNVYEWVSSLYLPYDSSEDREADTGDRTDVRRVLRGGSWLNSYSTDLRASVRDGYRPGSGYYDVGIRCARSYNPES